jgi:hypothetical protein
VVEDGGWKRRLRSVFLDQGGQLITSPQERPPSRHSPCPTSEALAAFVDQALPPRERDRIVAHLAGCDDCYAVVAEAMHTVDELAAAEGTAGETAEEADPDPAPGRGEPGRVRRLRPAVLVGLPLAAAVILAVGLWPRLGGATVPPAAELAARLAAGGALASLPGAWSEHGWVPTLRGHEVPVGSCGRPAFCLGVVSVDLAAALAAGAPEAARLADHSATLLAASIEFSDDLVGRYRDLAGELAGPAPDLPAARAAAAAIDADVAALLLDAERADHALGRWAEAGRLAAAGGDRGFFAAGSPYVRFGRRLDLGKVPPPARDSTAAVRDLLAGGVEPGDLTALAARLGDLVRTAGAA